MPLLLMALGASVALAAPKRIPSLVQPPGDERLPGKIIWADIITTDPNQTARFYAALFNWTPRTYTDEGGKYVVLANADGPVVGVARGPNRKDRRPSARWMAYFSSRNLDQAAESVKANGGRLLAGPVMLPDRGWHVFAADNEGALFGLMNSTSGDPPDAEIGEGGLLWFNLFAHNPTGVASFYESVAGVDSAPGRQSAILLSADGVTRGSISPMPERTTASPTWVPFFRVGDIERKARLARRLGARTVIEMTELEGGMQVIVLADQTGAVFALAQGEFQSEEASQ